MTVIVALDSGITNSADTQGGWVSGTLASLGTSTAATVVFDLGTNWRAMRSLVVSGVGLTDSTSGTVTATFASNPAANQRVTPGINPNSISGKVSYTGALSGLAFQLMVNDRYLAILFTNGSTAAQSASAGLRIVAHDL